MQSIRNDHLALEELRWCYRVDDWESVADRVLQSRIVLTAPDLALGSVASPQSAATDRS